ncbi:hypothetical protein HYV88_03250 [Candidatus Woesearchaeota archaeon]|nr:hypothetical protein [Candidatus Woesearchaeota archaeon]
MEMYETLMKKALNDFKTVDHMVYVTYPLVNDPKLMFGIVDKLFNTLIDVITAVLNYDYLYKRISHVPESLNEKLELFKKVIGKRYNFNGNIFLLLEELNKFKEFRKRSPMEFVRRDNLVICSSGFNTKSLNYKKVKEYVNKSKEFMNNANMLLIKNGI